VKAETAIKYSSLLSVPAIIGATIIETKDCHIVSLLPILIGVLSSMIVGYVSYKILIRLIKNQDLHRFAYYCWAVGTIALMTALLEIAP
jgi:undecaprenyl-diphosphatase